ncbi:MAG: hypothetical protein AAB916_02455 [Patescibacteria group bacterium]
MAEDWRSHWRSLTRQADVLENETWYVEKMRDLRKVRDELEKEEKDLNFFIEKEGSPLTDGERFLTRLQALGDADETVLIAAYLHNNRDTPKRNGLPTDRWHVEREVKHLRYWRDKLERETDAQRLEIERLRKQSTIVRKQGRLLWP